MLKELKKSPAFLKRFPETSRYNDPRAQRLRQFLDKVDYNWYDYGILPPVIDQFDAPCCALVAFGTTVSAHLSIQLKMMVLYIVSYQWLIDKATYTDDSGISLLDCIEFFIKYGACLEYHYKTTVDMKKSPTGGGPDVGARVRIEGFKYFEKKPKFDTVCEYIKNNGPLFAGINFYKGFEQHKGEEVYKHKEDLLTRKHNKKTLVDVDEELSEDVLVEITRDFYKQGSGDAPKTRQMHAVCVIGFHLASRSLLVQNSYGTAFGVEGLALIDFDCFAGIFGFPFNIYFDCGGCPRLPEMETCQTSGDMI